MELEGRVAIVTGGAVGTGRAIAERLAAEGAVVAIADVDDAGAGETVGRIANAGGVLRASERIPATLNLSGTQCNSPHPSGVRSATIGAIAAAEG